MKPLKEMLKRKKVEDETNGIPNMAHYSGSRHLQWDEIPLGLGVNGEVLWNVQKSPHMLVSGATGSGKSVLQRAVFLHLLQHSDRWSFIGIDPKQVELSPYSKYKDTVIGIGNTTETSIDLIRYAYNTMYERYEKMEELGIDNFLELPDAPKAILLMVDEITILLSPSGIKSDEGKEIDTLKAEASILLENIARLGRASGIYLLLALQRPDATVIKGELKNNLNARVACGRMDSTPSMMVLDSIAATDIPVIRGRAIYKVGETETEFQMFYAPPSWGDEYLESKKEMV